MRLTPKAFCMVATVPVSWMVRRTGPVGSGTMMRPNSSAKAWTSLIAAGAGAGCWGVLRGGGCCFTRRLGALRGAFRLTMTETVIFAADGAGVSPFAWTSGGLSLPGRTTRGAAERWGVDFFFVAMWVLQFGDEL